MSPSLAHIRYLHPGGWLLLEMRFDCLAFALNNTTPHHPGQLLRINAISYRVDKVIALDDGGQDVLLQRTEPPPWAAQDCEIVLHF